jgi:hypothetical protein
LSNSSSIWLLLLWIRQVGVDGQGILGPALNAELLRNAVEDILQANHLANGRGFTLEPRHVQVSQHRYIHRGMLNQGALKRAELILAAEITSYGSPRILGVLSRLTATINVTKAQQPDLSGHPSRRLSAVI